MATDPNRIASYPDLLELLAREGVLHQARTEEKSVTIPTEKGALDGMLLMRWQDSDGIIQFIQSLPLEIPTDKIAAMESAIARLNHALALPGFDLNHEYRMLTYRQILPIYPRGYVHPAEIQAMFRVTVKTAADFLPTLARILRGEGRLENIVADAQRDAEAAAAPVGPTPTAAAPATPAAPAAAPADGTAAPKVPGALDTY